MIAIGVVSMAIERLLEVEKERNSLDRAPVSVLGTKQLREPK
jgi:hypothetical protein